MTTTKRPRGFDMDGVVDAALRVFWAQGYEATSLTDLTKAMGINRPALYSEFTSKEALFRTVVERYYAITAAYVPDALARPTPRRVAEAFLRGSVDEFTMPGRPHGCLTIQGAMTSTPESSQIAEFLATRRTVEQERIVHRFRQFNAHRSPDSRIDEVGLARYVCLISLGIAVQASAGVGRADLHQTVDLAITVVPD